MNKIFLAAAVLAISAVQASAAILAADDFNYTAGGDLAGNTAPVGGTWGFVGGTTGNAAIDPTISPINLSHSDRPPNAGFSVDIDGSNPSGNAKLPDMPDQTAANTSNGTVYYSLLLNVNDITATGTAATGSYIAGYSNNDTLATGGATSIASGTAAGVLLIRGDQDLTTIDDFYNLGVGVTENNADRVFSTAQLSPGTTYFVVIGYQFGSGADDDVATLHINPLPATYGAAVAPAADQTSLGSANITTADRAALASFFFRNNAVAPNETLIDNLRIGNTWEEVTVVPEPAALGLTGMGMLGLLARRRRA